MQLRQKIAAVAASLVLPVPAGAEAAEPVYAMDYAKTEFRRGEKIGIKKAGLLCLPNGNVRWGIGKFFVGPAELSALVAARLAGKGLKMAEAAPASGLAGAGVDAPTHLIGLTVTGARFELCVPRWGLGNISRVKGTGRVTARWDIFSKAEQRVVLTRVTEQAVTSETASFADFMASLVESNADQFVKEAPLPGSARR